jgi:hypothetical protein
MAVQWQRMEEADPVSEQAQQPQSKELPRPHEVKAALRPIASLSNLAGHELGLRGPGEATALPLLGTSAHGRADELWEPRTGT